MLVHEGARLWQYKHNPAFVSKKDVSNLVSEGWAMRVQERVQKELGFWGKFDAKAYSVGCSLPAPFRGLITGKPREYTVGRNLYKRIGVQRGWKAEVKAAKGCVTESDLLDRANASIWFRIYSM